MHRLFVALRPSPALRAALCAAMGGVPGARWQDDAQLHLTLRFLGSLDSRQANDVAEELSGVTGPRPIVEVGGTGTFHRRGLVHTIWAGVRADEGLLRLQARVERAVQRAGLPPEHRAFHPHITLARAGRTTAPVEPFLVQTARLSAPAERCDAFLLYESHLSQEGAMYEPVARYPLA